MGGPHILKLTFHRKPELQYNAAQLYGYFANTPEWKPYMEDEIGYASLEKPVPLQSADLLAREYMKSIDDFFGPKHRQPRKAMRALHGSHRFIFSYYGASKFAQMKEYAAGIGAPQIGEYYNWVVSNNVSDNMTSRIRWLTFLDPARKFQPTPPPYWYDKIS